MDITINLTDHRISIKDKKIKKYFYRDSIVSDLIFLEPVGGTVGDIPDIVYENINIQGVFGVKKEVFMDKNQDLLIGYSKIFTKEQILTLTGLDN